MPSGTKPKGATSCPRSRSSWTTAYGAIATPTPAAAVHGGLRGVGGEQTLELLGCHLEEVTDAGGVEGFEDEGHVGGAPGAGRHVAETRERLREVIGRAPHEARVVPRPAC